MTKQDFGHESGADNSVAVGMGADRHSVKEWIIVAGILAGALILRLGVAEWMLVHGKSQFPDSELYLRYAATIREGGEYLADGHLARRTPGYPLFLAGCLSIGGDSLRSVLWAQSAIGTLTCFFVYCIARTLVCGSVPETTPIYSLVLIAIDPYALALNGLVLSETLTAFLLAGLCYLWLRNYHVGGGLRSACFGVIAGSLILVRPSSLLLIPLLMAAWWKAKCSKLQWLLQIALATITMLCLLAPWWIRNARVFHRFVPTTLNVGESLYDGVGPMATGASDTSFANDPEIQRLTEVDQDRYWWQQSISEIQKEPGRVLALALVKIARFWSPWPNESEFRALLVVLGTTLGTVPVWLFGLLAVWRNRRRWDFLVVTVVPISYFCALHAVFVSSVRYRVPVGGMFALLGGAGIAIVHRALTEEKKLPDSEMR